MSDTNPTPTPEVTPTLPEAAVASSAPVDFRVSGSTTATDLRRELSDVLKFVESDGLKTVAITRHGKVVAAVVGGIEFKLLQRLKESAKSLAPKLGLTVEAFLDNLASVEHQVDSDVNTNTERLSIQAVPATLLSPQDQIKYAQETLKMIGELHKGEGTISGFVISVEPAQPVFGDSPANAPGAVTGNSFEN